MGVIAGLAAALAWTVASSLWRSLSTSLNALQLNGLKNAIACLLLLPVLLTLDWGSAPQIWGLLLLSGVVGIAAGDSFYLAALRRLGTRRTLTVEALSPLVAAISGMLWMGEAMQPRTWLAAGLVSLSVLIVAHQHPPERTTPDARGINAQMLGISLALLAVSCGVAGAALSRSVLTDAEVHPLQSAAVRLLGGLIALVPWLGLSWHGLNWSSGWTRVIGSRRPKPQQRRAWRVVIATLLGTNLGILLQQIVLQQLPLAMAVTLLSSAPVMALLVAHHEGDHPHGAGVVASLMAVSGVAIAVLN